MYIGSALQVGLSYYYLIFLGLLFLLNSFAANRTCLKHHMYKYKMCFMQLYCYFIASNPCPFVLFL